MASRREHKRSVDAKREIYAGLTTKTKAELVEIGRRYGLSLSTRSKKEDLIHAIKLAYRKIYA
jgi:Rho termination factor, N-terminal domain